MTLDTSKIEILTVRVQATPGTNRAEAIREAMRLTVNEWVNVELIFNGATINVLINDLFAAVLRDPVATDGKCEHGISFNATCQPCSRSVWKG